MTRLLGRGLKVAGLAAAVAATVVASLALGSLEGADLAGDYGSTVVWDLRWPRTVTGLAVGAALAVSGALMQAVTRNPLADPSVLGLNAGAALAVVLAVTFGGLTHPGAIIWFAFVGAGLTAATVWALGAAGRGGDPAKLALAGVVLTALVGSWTSAILLQNEKSLDVVRFWLAGSLSGRDLGTFALLAPLLALGVGASFFLARSLDLLGLGSDTARSLGLRPALTRNLALGLVVLLTGTSVALAGPVGFIGLAVPHLARGLGATSVRSLLGLSIVLGPVLLLGADVVGRVVLRPTEVPVGIVTALVGAPLLIAFARSLRGGRR